MHAAAPLMARHLGSKAVPTGLSQSSDDLPPHTGHPTRAAARPCPGCLPGAVLAVVTTCPRGLFRCVVVAALAVPFAEMAGLSLKSIVMPR